MSFYFTAPHCPSNKRICKSRRFDLFCPFCSLSRIDFPLCATVSVYVCVHACMLTVPYVSVCRKPEDLSREVIQIQQREFALKEQNYTLNSR